MIPFPARWGPGGGASTTCGSSLPVCHEFRQRARFPCCVETHRPAPSPSTEGERMPWRRGRWKDLSAGVRRGLGHPASGRYGFGGFRPLTTWRCPFILSVCRMDCTLTHRILTFPERDGGFFLLEGILSAASSHDTPSHWRLSRHTGSFTSSEASLTPVGRPTGSRGEPVRTPSRTD